MNQSRKAIYLDHAATTPMRAEVLESMQPYFTEFYGNPSSIHAIGRRANVALENARRIIADLLGAASHEIVFTSGGTEGDNAALRGIALARRHLTGANRIITTPVEHHAVLHTAYALRDHFGFELTLLPVNAEGSVALRDVEAAVADGSDVALVSTMYANNEIGTIQPLAEIGELCHHMGVPLHTDAVQAAGKLPLNVNELQVDALSVSAHKFYGPKVVGFLYLRRGTPYQPVQTGGSHEGDRRAGTENVPGIVGLAKAFALAEADRPQEAARLHLLREQLIGGILEEVAGVTLTGARTARVSNIASFIIAGVEAEGLLIGLDLAGIAAGSGSACASGSQRPSHVLEAIGIPPTAAQGALRFSLGRANQPEDIAYVLETLPKIVTQIRSSAPVAL
ncbi:MAG: cysteine desulfurase [Caldilineaceae bacterium]|nr:cysteine desulfurase [Caldilineaceae bacterium]